MRGQEREEALERLLGVTQDSTTVESEEDIRAMKELAEAVEKCVRGEKPDAMGLDWLEDFKSDTLVCLGIFLSTTYRAKSFISKYIHCNPELLWRFLLNRYSSKCLGMARSLKSSTRSSFPCHVRIPIRSSNRKVWQGSTKKGGSHGNGEAFPSFTQKYL